MQFARKILPLLVVMSLPALMVGCGGDDGKTVLTELTERTVKPV